MFSFGQGRAFPNTFSVRAHCSDFQSVQHQCHSESMKYHTLSRNTIQSGTIPCYIIWQRLISCNVTKRTCSVQSFQTSWVNSTHIFQSLFNTIKWEVRCQILGPVYCQGDETSFWCWVDLTDTGHGHFLPLGGLHHKMLAFEAFSI